MSEYFQKFSHLIKIYIQCTIQNSQPTKQFCCLLYTFHKWFISALRDSLHNEVLKKGYNAEFSTIDQLYKTARIIEEASYYNHGMRRAENAHTAATNTKPAVHKALLPTAQLRTIIGRENVVHHMQPMHTYHAPKPEQKTVQVKDSLTKLSY